MKKYLLMSIAIFGLINFCHAQEYVNDFRDRLQFGLKAGINYSNVYDAKGEEFQAKAKTGLAFGLFTAIPIGKYLGFHPEILFSQKGFKATGKVLGGNYNFTRTTNFIDIPLLFALKPSPYFTLLAGPQYSYLLKQRDVFANATTSIAQEQEFENENIRKNILCFLGGFDVNVNHIVLSARVGWDITNNNGDGTSTTPRYKNMWYQATVGYRFYSN
ncbi:MAG: porin family protein [Bacteroidetes bacterium]|nr:porin family protein [Bacteroidota bacterium]